MEAKGAYVLLMDAGDFSQGDPTVSVSEGATAVEMMDLAGYDLAAPGNHEFDYGYPNLAKLADEAKFPLVAANVLYNGKVAFEDHVPSPLPAVLRSAYSAWTRRRLPRRPIPPRSRA